MPWFAGGTAGLPTVTLGYLIGMILASAVIGALARRGTDRTPWRTIPTMLLGNLVVYAVGVPWLAVTLHLGTQQAIAAGLTPFLVGDALKVVIAAGLLPAVWRRCEPEGLNRPSAS